MKPFLSLFGWALVLCGVGLGVSGLTADVTVQVGGEYVPLVGYMPAAEQVNFHLMFGALLRLVAGGFLLTTGAVLAIGGELLTPREAKEAATAEPRRSDLRPVMIGAAFVAVAIAVLALREGPGVERQGPGTVAAAVDAATDADQLAADAAADAALAADAIARKGSDQASPPARPAAREEAPTPEDVADINRRLAEFEAPGA